jgi:transcriptional regulator with XRE-family HTH domain
MSKKKLSQLLLETREAKKLTQVQYAKMIKISPMTYPRLERGEQKASAKTLSLLIKNSGLSAGQIIEGWENEYGDK